MKIHFIILYLLSVASAFSLTLDEARKAAETFVVQQGYTSVPTKLTPEELSASSFERVPRSEWPKHRQNMIEPPVVAVTPKLLRPYGFKNDAGWTFGFRFIVPDSASEYVRDYVKKHYFAVQVSQDGSEIIALHSAPFIDAFEPLSVKKAQSGRRE
jgi:hypothetical protein